MENFLLPLVVMLVVVVIMSVGVIFGKKPIQGSCGGIGNLMQEEGVEYVCDMCGSTNPEICDNPEEN